MVYRADVATRVLDPSGSWQKRIFVAEFGDPGGASARAAAAPASREPGPSRPLLARGRRLRLRLRLRLMRRLRLVLAAGLVQGLTGPGPRSGGGARLGRLGLGEMLGARPGHVPGPHRGVRRELHGWHGILLSPVSYIRPGRTTARLARRRAGGCSSPRSAASAT